MKTRLKQQINQVLYIRKYCVPVEQTNFHCVGCGECCKHRGDIFRAPTDIYYACRHLKLSLKEFLDTYTEFRGIELFLKDKRDAEKTCILYTEKEGCRIHTVKPKACYMYPFLENRK